jgi:hypothetical protein
MIKNIFFGLVIFQMKKIESLVYKCLTIDQNIIKSDIDNAQIHQHKQTCWKKFKQIVNFNILNHQ